jgi:hypothetical protein
LCETLFIAAVGATHIHSSESPFAKQRLAKTRSHVSEDSTKVSVNTRLRKQWVLRCLIASISVGTENLHGYAQADIRTRGLARQTPYAGEPRTTFRESFIVRSITVQRLTKAQQTEACPRIDYSDSKYLYTWLTLQASTIPHGELNLPLVPPTPPRPAFTQSKSMSRVHLGLLPRSSVLQSQQNPIIPLRIHYPTLNVVRRPVMKLIERLCVVRQLSGRHKLRYCS